MPVAWVALCSHLLIQDGMHHSDSDCESLDEGGFFEGNISANIPTTKNTMAHVIQVTTSQPLGATLGKNAGVMYIPKDISIKARPRLLEVISSFFLGSSLFFLSSMLQGNLRST